MLNNKITFITFSFVFTMFCFYFFQPTLSYGFFGIPFILFIIGIFIFFVSNFKYKIPFIIGILALIVVPFITTFTGFHSSSFRNLLGTVKTKKFSKDVSPIDIKKVRIVDQNLAKKLGEKLLGSNPALGSIVTLGEFNIQLVNKKLYWVAPLLHSGFFKWLNSKGTPGYIMVSATNEEDIKLIQEIKGKKINIKYQPNAFFSENLQRYMYFHGFMETGLTDYTFELDEEGNPFYVVTIYKKEIGFGGENAIGVAILNPQTGLIKKYNMSNIPNWVDRVQPEKFIIKQINNWGELIHGWFNSIFSQKGTLTSSKGMSLVYGSDNKSYWYTGMTSVGKDSSTVGFMLVNTKTKEAKWYKQSGATEDKAARSAEGEVQEKGYKATSPILYNVLGSPTYVCTLKDNEGLVKLIAFVSVENYSIVGTGKTIKSALRNYKSLLSANGNNNILSSNFKTTKLVGIISRFSRNIKNGNTFYYFQIKNDKKEKVYMTNSNLSDDIILTKRGDKVSFEYENTNTKYVDLIKFKNSSF